MLNSLLPDDFFPITGSLGTQNQVSLSSYISPLSHMPIYHVTSIKTTNLTIFLTLFIFSFQGVISFCYLLH